MYASVCFVVCGRERERERKRRRERGGGGDKDSGIISEDYKKMTPTIKE